MCICVYVCTLESLCSYISDVANLSSRACECKGQHKVVNSLPHYAGHRLDPSFVTTVLSIELDHWPGILVYKMLDDLKLVEQD